MLNYIYLGFKQNYHLTTIKLNSWHLNACHAHFLFMLMYLGKCTILVYWLYWDYLLKLNLLTRCGNFIFSTLFVQKGPKISSTKFSAFWPKLPNQFLQFGVTDSFPFSAVFPNFIFGIFVGHLNSSSGHSQFSISSSLFCNLQAHIKETSSPSIYEPLCSLGGWKCWW